MQLIIHCKLRSGAYLQIYLLLLNLNIRQIPRIYNCFKIQNIWKILKKNYNYLQLNP